MGFTVRSLYCVPTVIPSHPSGRSLNLTLEISRGAGLTAKDGGDIFPFTVTDRQGEGARVCDCPTGPMQPGDMKKSTSIGVALVEIPPTPPLVGEPLFPAPVGVPPLLGPGSGMAGGWYLELWGTPHQPSCMFRSSEEKARLLTLGCGDVQNRSQ